MASIAYRRATAADLEFVRESWIENYRHSHFAGPVPMPLYRELYERILDWVIGREGVEVLVAYKPGEAPPHDVYGWVCTERGGLEPVRIFSNGRYEERLEPTKQPIVHYVYVRLPFRTLGMARRLFKAAGVNPLEPFVHTFKTAPAAKLRAKVPLARFDPRCIRFPKQHPKPNTHEAQDEAPIRAVHAPAED